MTDVVPSKAVLRVMLEQRAPGAGSLIDALKERFNARLVALRVGPVKVGNVGYWEKECARCEPYVHPEVARPWKEEKADLKAREEVRARAAKPVTPRAKGRRAAPKN